MQHNNLSRNDTTLLVSVLFCLFLKPQILKKAAPKHDMSKLLTTGFEMFTFFVIHCAKATPKRCDPPLNVKAVLGTQY
jgi:hypothetical protein